MFFFFFFFFIEDRYSVDGNEGIPQILLNFLPEHKKVLNSVNTC